jgi:hypothetical protein
VNEDDARRRLADENEEFLDSDEARPLRILAEYLEQHPNPYVTPEILELFQFACDPETALAYLKSRIQRSP